MRSNGSQIQGSLKGGSKRTVFVVNTVPLVYQQAEAIQKHTPFTVGKYEHSMGVDYWTDKEAVHDLMSDDASKDNKVENQSSCYNPWTEHEVSDKSIADCTEAITGAYLLVCGDKAAASFLDWLGIGVFKGKSLLMEPKIVRTACVREECAQDIEMFYRRAVLKRLEEKIGYSFRDRSFIVQAVTHSSYRNNLVTDCYQRLEFLGDAAALPTTLQESCQI